MVMETKKKAPNSADQTGEVTALDHLQNAIVSSFNVLGPWGSLFSAAISNYVTTKRLKHIQGVVDAMAERLSSIRKDCLEKVLSSDEFLHLFVTSLEKAQNEHREAKRRHYGVMLANMASEPKLEYDLFEHFLSLLGEIGDLHIALLAELDRRGVREQGEEGWASFEDLVGATEGGVRQAREVVASGLEKLAAYGIVKTSGSPKIMRNTNPVGLWYVSSYSITPTGQRFVRFLRTD